MNKPNIQTTKQVVPMLYGYSTPEVVRHNGWTKIGYTEQDVETRINQQTHTADIKWQLEWKGNATFDDGSGETFIDKDFHAYLRKSGIEQEKGKNNEWFHVDGATSKQMFRDFREDHGILKMTETVIPYKLREEQQSAVAMTVDYQATHKNGEFLWNAKPRFGKTLSVYDFVQKTRAEKVLIVTNRPAIANSWFSDYAKFLGSESGYLFVSEVDALKGKQGVLTREEYTHLLLGKDNDNVKCVEFVSLQDMKGSIYFGGEHNKLGEVANMEWDTLVIDEAHLKDILLNVEEPEEIPTIFEPKFIAQKLNTSQQQAVIKALNSENIGLIQGPPGTGKTKVIKEIIGQVVTKSIKTADSPRILIVSQSHTAVDNILEGLDSTISDDLEIVRIGADKNVSPKITCRYTMPAHRDKLFSDVKKNVEEYDKSMEEVYQDISDQRVLDRWKKIKEIQKDWIDRSVEKDCLDYQLVRSATVIAGTCIGFLANSFVKDMEFDYVIIDEAAKATTPELLVSIIKAKKIILVGDQNQLPAYADQSISPKIAKLTKNPEYRMFDILFETLPNSHKQVLSTQYRMIRNIGNLISTVFYGGTIDTGCKDEDKLHGLSRYEGNSIIWFDTSENRRRKQKKTKGNSFMNEEEKRIILDILEDLKKSNELDNQDIGIITGYSGQKDILRNSVKAIGYDKIAQIDINVLDAFQGRENDIIMYSTVRTDNSIGFQKEKERVNVAFSRAKKLLIICGDLNFFYNYNDPNNKFIEIIDYIRTHDHCKIISCKGGNLF